MRGSSRKNSQITPEKCIYCGATDRFDSCGCCSALACKSCLKKFDFKEGQKTYPKLSTLFEIYKKSIPSSIGALCPSCLGMIKEESSLPPVVCSNCKKLPERHNCGLCGIAGCKDYCPKFVAKDLLRKYPKTVDRAAVFGKAPPDSEHIRLCKRCLDAAKGIQGPPCPFCTKIIVTGLECSFCSELGCHGCVVKSFTKDFIEKFPQAKARFEKFGKDVPTTRGVRVCPPCLQAVGVEVAKPAAPPKTGGERGVGASKKKHIDLATSTTDASFDDEETYIGHDEITNLERLGASGNFGSIFTAKWGGTEVALKKMSDPSPEHEEELKKEMRVVQAIQKRCPNVMKCYDLWRAPPGQAFAGELFMVMEFFPEGSLIDYLSHLESRGGKTGNWLAEVLLACSKGILQLHRTKTVHRDIAARNILVRTSMGRGQQLRLECFLADFGLAGSIESNVEKRPWRTTSPEALVNPPQWSTKSDVWSFGLLLWEVGTNEKPFAQVRYGNDFNDVQKNVLKFHPQPPAFNSGMYDLFSRCLAYRPDDRPDMSEVESYLSKLAAMTTAPVDVSQAEYQ